MDTQNSTQPAPPALPLKTLQQMEDEHIVNVLAATATLDEAAHVLGIDIVTLYRKRVRMNLALRPRNSSGPLTKKPKLSAYETFNSKPASCSRNDPDDHPAGASRVSNQL